MRKSKVVFLLPLCISLASGCSNINIKYYQPNPNTSNTQPSQNNTNEVEDFFDSSSTTYTDNVTSVTLETLYETCKKATVTIETYVTYTKQGITASTSLYSSGSGFIAKESENYLYIYTNAHVINVNSNSIQSVETEVILSDYTRYKATIIASDGEEDVGIIRIDKPSSDSYLVASIGDSKQVKTGEAVFAIGSPLGLDYAQTLTSGVISGVNIKTDTDNDEDGTETTMYLLQTDTAINPGNSGGPLFNYKGEVIGINTLKILQSDSGVDLEGIGFAIPSTHFELVASTIINGDTYTRPLVGISAMAVSSLSLQTRETYNIKVQSGLYVAEITNKDLTLKEKTIITHINNKLIYTFSDFASELYNYKKGDTINLTYCELDGSNSQTITVTLI